MGINWEEYTCGFCSTVGVMAGNYFPCDWSMYVFEDPDDSDIIRIYWVCRECTEERRESEIQNF